MVVALGRGESSGDGGDVAWDTLWLRETRRDDGGAYRSRDGLQRTGYRNINAASSSSSELPDEHQIA